MNPPVPTTMAFSTDVHAREHLCDHVLTRPEAHDWSVVLPGYSLVVNPGNDTALRTIAASLFNSSPEKEGLNLLEKYLNAIRQAMDDAVCLGWWWETRRSKYSEWYGLGLDGIFVVWDRQVVKSGYFPATARYPPQKSIPRTDNPLPRRNPVELLRPPPVSPRRRYELYRDNHYWISNKYARVYDEITQAGGDAFVDPSAPLRIGKWQQLLDEQRATDHDNEEQS